MEHSADPLAPAAKPRRKRARLVWILLLIITCTAIPIVYHKQIRFKLFPKNFGTVAQGVLYRGADQHLPVMRDILVDNQIRTVIDLTGVDDGENQLCRELGVDRYAFPFPGDGRGDPTLWAAVLTLLADSERYPIFVHCAAGAQRATTATLLYHKYVSGENFQEAYPESFGYRHKPDEWELVAFLADHAAEIEAMWKSNQVEQDGKTVNLDQIVNDALGTK